MSSIVATPDTIYRSDVCIYPKRIKYFGSSTIQGIKFLWTSWSYWTRQIGLCLILVGLVSPVTSQDIYKSRVLDIHDRGPLTNTPVFGSVEPVWTMDPNFEFYVPPEASSLSLSFYLHAPFVDETKGARVTLVVGQTIEEILVTQPKFVRMDLRKGQSLFIHVKNCVVPAHLDPTNPDDRTLCVGLSQIRLTPPSFLVRFLEVLW